MPGFVESSHVTKNNMPHPQNSARGYAKHLISPVMPTTYFHIPLLLRQITMIFVARDLRLLLDWILTK
jgi:hypothetical protein